MTRTPGLSSNQGTKSIDHVIVAPKKSLKYGSPKPRLLLPFPFESRQALAPFQREELTTGQRSLLDILALTAKPGL